MQTIKTNKLHLRWNTSIAMLLKKCFQNEWTNIFNLPIHCHIKSTNLQEDTKDVGKKTDFR